MTNLPILLCGNAQGSGLGKIALDQLSTSLSNFSARAIQFLETDSSPETTTFGPFCGRVILENGCAALLGRLDPFRLIYLSEFQSQPEYSPGRRVRSAFAWAGDVIPDEKSPAALWDPDHDLPKISRSLFSKHLDHVYWKPALESLLDHIGANAAVELADILSLDSANYISSTKGKCMQLYSQLSKGVHWEFFSSTLQMDEDTVKSLLRDTLVHVAGLGLVSHFVPTAYASIGHDDAIAEYINFRRAVP